MVYLHFISLEKCDNIVYCNPYVENILSYVTYVTGLNASSTELNTLGNAL